jgi:hypothetical protein
MNEWETYYFSVLNGKRKEIIWRTGAKERAYEWGKRSNLIWMEPTDKTHLARCIVFTYQAAMAAKSLKLITGLSLL